MLNSQTTTDQQFQIYLSCRFCYVYIVTSPISLFLFIHSIQKWSTYEASLCICIVSLQALSYLSTRSDTNSSDESSVTFSSLTSQPWQLLSTSKLMEQAGNAYFLLAESAMSLNKLGRALRYGKYSILCSSKFLILVKL